MLNMYRTFHIERFKAKNLIFIDRDKCIVKTEDSYFTIFLHSKNI